MKTSAGVVCSNAGHREPIYAQSHKAGAQHGVASFCTPALARARHALGVNVHSHGQRQRWLEPCAVTPAKAPSAQAQSDACIFVLGLSILSDGANVETARVSSCGQGPQLPQIEQERSYSSTTFDHHLQVADTSRNVYRISILRAQACYTIWSKSVREKNSERRLNRSKTARSWSKECSMSDRCLNVASRGGQNRQHRQSCSSSLRARPAASLQCLRQRIQETSERPSARRERRLQRGQSIWVRLRR